MYSYSTWSMWLGLPNSQAAYMHTIVCLYRLSNWIWYKWCAEMLFEQNSLFTMGKCKHLIMPVGHRTVPLRSITCHVRGEAFAFWTLKFFGRRLEDLWSTLWSNGEFNVVKLTSLIDLIELKLQIELKSSYDGFCADIVRSCKIETVDFSRIAVGPTWEL